ncbi:MAG: asparaginase domain-containing protein [Lachnospiraceae bacterium]|nr:asparaginase domain-containing protein [Lachnospiraceae bacterium]
MKKILVILTGGTIGSAVLGKDMDVTGDSPYQLIHFYHQAYGMEEEFEVRAPLTVLSENMQPELWNVLCRAMCEIDYRDYRGVIVAHGSDTLAYSSALLGMLLGNVPAPVVLTAGNYPLEDKRSNGLANFRGAVELIDSGITGGVYTVYQTNRGKMPVYLASRLQEADAYSDQFDSFGKTPFGEMKEGRFVPFLSGINPEMKELAGAEGLMRYGCPDFQKDILMLRPYPGLRYDNITFERKPAAVIHYLYHSATACTLGEPYSLPAFLERCQKEEIPVYTASYKEDEERLYVTARRVMEMGAVPMGSISAEAAYMKLQLLYNMNLADREKFAGKNIYFEKLPARKEI